MDGFTPFVQKMQARGIEPQVIEAFRTAFLRLKEGDQGLKTEESLTQVTDLKHYGELKSFEEFGQTLTGQLAVIKLNGGLGTGMGLSGPKSLLTVKGTESFLDIIVKQAECAQVSTVFMNSFSTDAATRKHFTGLPAQPMMFLQSMVPKISADFQPASWPKNPELEWCPPGHGDIYNSLLASGTLARLLALGKRWAFISNSDNLGATIDHALLGYMATCKAPFVMEVAERTIADKKGGHLARVGKNLVLRERAQCPEEDLAQFEDISRHRFFNTNNIWIDLNFLKENLTSGPFDLPIIINTKNIDPQDLSTRKVIQLESAMGSAIEKIPGAQAILVPKRRFAPVKTTNELLVVRSDVYQLDENYRLSACRERLPKVDLDARFFKMIDDFDQRFKGIPSLKDCESLQVIGDFVFKAGTTFKGDVRLQNATPNQVVYRDEDV